MLKIVEKIKPFWKPFIFLFLIFFLIANRNTVSRVLPYFNYRVIYSVFSNLAEEITSPSKDLTRTFRDKQNIDMVEKNMIEEKNENRKGKEDKINDEYNYYKENIIEIPKIGIISPIVFSQEYDKEVLEEILKEGVLHYPDSALPGEKGLIIILGHSAPENWPKVNYDWVFSDLNKLEKGDIVYIYFNEHQYDYIVRNKFFLEKGEEIPSLGLEKQRPEENRY